MFGARAVLSSMAIVFSGTCAAAEADNATRKNWFNDPFFQVRSSVSHCPTPRGPLLTETEMKSESHSRVERGTSCWMAGKCAQPNAYLYDTALAKSIQARFDKSEAFKDASLWITVKRKFVWVEGCVTSGADKNRLETFVQSEPDVERVIVNVTTDEPGKPPYPTIERDE